MAEELILTDPVTKPAETTTKYRVMAINMDIEMMNFPTSNPPTPVPNGLIDIRLKDDIGKYLTHQYRGDEAINLMKVLNTANLTTKSMHKRILEKLSADGVIPGTVTGTPDPPTTSDEPSI